MSKKVLTIAGVAAVLFLGVLYLTMGHQTCGTVYNDVGPDSVSDSLAVQRGDTVRTAIEGIDTAAQIDTSRAMHRRCINHDTGQNRGATIAGAIILLALIGYIAYRIAKRQHERTFLRDDWSPSTGYPMPTSKPTPPKPKPTPPPDLP